jgi:hypothetical protein
MAYEAFCPQCGSPLAGGQCPRGDHVSDRPGARYIGQWNWGAFCLTPLWLLNHGCIWYGILYMVIGLVPFLGLVCLPAAIYCGISGNKIAVTRRRFADEAQFVAVQNAWRNWGIPIFFGLPILSLIYLVLNVGRSALQPLH